MCGLPAIKGFPASTARNRLALLYAVEAANAVSAILLVVGLAFYTSHRFGWGARENFSVAASQGALYMIGALLAQKISRRWGRRRSLIVLYACMTVFALSVGTCASMDWAFATALLAVLETSFVGASWPMLQSLISEAGEQSQLSKRLGFYNIVWSAVGAVSVAASGAVIEYAPPWAFFGIIVIGHIVAGLLILSSHRIKNGGASAQSPVQPEDLREKIARSPIDAVTMRRNRLALWLSRIALPSTYIIVYSISPALPTLHAMKLLTPTMATLVGSIWLISRAAAFLITIGTTFWHQRPGLLFLSSITMVFAFIGTIVPGAVTGIDITHALSAMIIAQIVLGLSIGTIYSASLYFGMVMSEGSTRHGGYHEALIGLGQVLGPLLGAAMQWIYPGTLMPAVICISGVVSISVFVEAAVGLRASGRLKRRCLNQIN